MNEYHVAWQPQPTVNKLHRSVCLLWLLLIINGFIFWKLGVFFLSYRVYLHFAGAHSFFFFFYFISTINFTKQSETKVRESLKTCVFERFLLGFEWDGWEKALNLKWVSEVTGGFLPGRFRRALKSHVGFRSAGGFPASGRLEPIRFHSFNSSLKGFVSIHWTTHNKWSWEHDRLNPRRTRRPVMNEPGGPWLTALNQTGHRQVEIAALKPG